MENNKNVIKTNLMMFFYFLLFAHLLINVSNSAVKWNFDKSGQDWPDSCKNGDQAPIDISKPFEFRKFNITFSYSNMMTEYLFLNDGNNLILEGDFGYLTYEDKTYFSSQILFYSPSLHTFSNNRMPFEMQIIHKDDLGNQISVSILYKFSKSDYSLFLAKLGFDKEQLRKQKPFAPVTIKEDIDLAKYVNSEKDFFVYESQQFLPPCGQHSLNFILTDVMKISEMQLKNFPEIVLNKNKEPQARNERKLYTTFRMEDVEAKLKEQAERLAIKKKEKEEFEKLKKLADKKINEKATNSTENHGSSEALNTKTTSDRPETAELSGEAKNKTETEKEDSAQKPAGNCVDKDFVSADVVKEKVKAYEKTIKANDLKVISGVSAQAPILTIDQELPDSESSRLRKELDEEFKLWRKLYVETLKENGSNQAKFFMQMKSLEKDFVEHKYEPYLNFVQLNIQHKAENTSLIETSEKKNSKKKKTFLRKRN